MEPLLLSIQEETLWPTRPLSRNRYSPTINKIPFDPTNPKLDWSWTTPKAFHSFIKAIHPSILTLTRNSFWESSFICLSVYDNPTLTWPGLHYPSSAQVTTPLFRLMWVKGNVVIKHRQRLMTGQMEERPPLSTAVGFQFLFSPHHHDSNPSTLISGSPKNAHHKILSMVFTSTTREENPYRVSACVT